MLDTCRSSYYYETHHVNTIPLTNQSQRKDIVSQGNSLERYVPLWTVIDTMSNKWKVCVGAYV